MRVGTTAMAAMVLSSLVLCANVFAQSQQDSDLESLLSDIGSAPQPAPAAETGGQPASEPVAAATTDAAPETILTFSA